MRPDYNLPAPLALAFHQDLERLEEERHMPYVTSIERMAREEGMEEGVKKAREGMLAALEIALEAKFGAPGFGLMPEIRAINDVDVLTTICQALKTANNVDELRRLWTK